MGFAEEDWRTFLRYLVAVERSDDFENAVLYYLRGILDFDGAIYLQIKEQGNLGLVVSEGIYCTEEELRDFCLRDPLFDLGRRTSGMESEKVKTISTDSLPTGKYRDALKEKRYTYVLMVKLDRTGEGFRLYRCGNRFTEEEISKLTLVADMLEQLLPQRKRMAAQQQDALLERSIREGLPYGLLVFDQELQPLQYNEEAILRLSECYSEQDVNSLLERFQHFLRTQIETMQATRSQSSSAIIGEYIAETIMLYDLERTGCSNHYVVSLYSKGWFHGVLFKSMDVIMAEQGLTQRELQIANCILQGFNTKEIADELFISSNTVKEHISSIFQKMDVHNRGEFIIKAFTSKS